MEKYSVLMSVYYKENPDFFRKALDSVIRQTVPPDEIVLVEDGSLTDELYSVIDQYQMQFPQLLTIIRNEKNLGLGLALNKGVKASRNELIARMDTDDIAVSDRCEKQLAFFSEHPDVSIVGGQIEEFIDDESNVVGKRIVPTTDRELKEYTKTRCPFNHMTVMFKKTDVRNAGNYKDWFWNEDYYLWIRMLLKECKFANLPETLVHVRVGREMYQRRGGKEYFQSEVNIQKYMLERNVISYPTYVQNVAKRLIVERLLPNSVRGWVFRTFARK